MRACIIAVPSRLYHAQKICTNLLTIGQHIDSVAIKMDYQGRGPWFNIERALWDSVSAWEPFLILQDDVLLNMQNPKLSIHLQQLEYQIRSSALGLISIFTPPQKRFREKAEQGYNAMIGNYFMWGQMFMVSPEFAKIVLAVDNFLSPEVKHHDEVRFRVASQVYQVDMMTVIGSLCRHNLEIPSTLGTGPKVGKTWRDTQILADSNTDFSEIEFFEYRTDADKQAYYRESA